MPAAEMTFTTLLTDLTGYAERSDQAFLDQRERFIMLAESRIAGEARGLGFIKSVLDTMVSGVNGSALAKPARWRETASLTIGKGTSFNTRKVLRLRSYEYIRYYWPDPTQTDEPVYYADWEWSWFLIGPTPSLAFPYELVFYEKPVPLDSNNSSNWTTQYAPQLLLFSCLLEASAWVKNKDLIASWQDGYQRALKQVEFDSKRRLLDRSAANPNPS